MILRPIAVLFAIWALLIPAVTAQVVQTNSPVLTNFAQVRALSTEEAGKKLPFHGKAVITYYDGMRSGFAQDGTSPSYLEALQLRAPIASGDLVEIEGVTGPGSFNPIVAVTRITRIAGNQPMPQPKARSIAELKSAQDDCAWIQTRGVVHEIRRQGNGAALRITAAGESLDLLVLNFTDDNAQRDNLLYAEIDIQGVLMVFSGRSSPMTAVQVAIPNPSCIKVITPPQPEDRLTTLNFQWLQADTQTNPLPRRLSVIGKVGNQRPGSAVVITNHEGSSIEALGIGNDIPPLIAGDWVRVSGFPIIRSNQVALERSKVEIVGLKRAPSAAQATNNGAPLHPEDFDQVRGRVLEIRGLSPAVANHGLPVCVRAVVTLADTNLWMLMIQQADQGIFVNPAAWPAVPLVPGDEVEVHGFSREGLVTPFIDAGQIKILGRAPLPVAASVTIDRIQYGQYDSELVKVSGFARSVTPDSGKRCKIEIVGQNASIDLLVLNVTNVENLQLLAGNRIEARGVCAVDRSANRQSGNSLLLVSSPGDLVTATPPTAGMTELPLSAAIEVQKLSQAGSNEPVRLKGTVLGEWVDGPAKRLFLSDKTANLILDIAEGTGLKPGTEIEVTGMSDLEGSTPILRTPKWRVIGKAELPDPVQLQAFSDWPPNRSGLVQIRATLVLARRTPAGGGLQLVLSQGRDLFEAYVQAEPELSSDRIPKPGSELSITGIITGQSRSAAFLNGAVILVRCPEDMVIISSPAWWTPRRIATAAGVVAICFLAGVGWVASLHRRVREQTEIIRKDLEAEAALEKRYQLVWESSADGMLMTDEAGVVRQVNDAYCKMVRKTREELIGQPYTTIWQRDLQEAILGNYRERFRNRNFAAQMVQEIVMWDGRKGAFELANSLFEQPGKPALLLSVIRDITERKRLEEELRTAQKMEAVGRLAGGVAHDFNNILTVIRGYTGLCKDDDRLPQDVREMLAEIDESASRAATLVRQLLTFSRRQPLNIRSVNLAKVVENMLQMLKRLLGDDVRVEFQQELPVPLIHADTGMMEQIIMNLAVNARDAMRDGGRLTIKVRGIEFTGETAKGSPDRRPGRYACLSVEDTGCGMDEQTLAQVFEPFFTTKDVGKGTGLGLSTVYGIVKQHFGWIEAVSEVGKGTQFQVYLPADETPITESVTEFRHRKK